jgi:hypothetical protein
MNEKIIGGDDDSLDGVEVVFGKFLVEKAPFKLSSAAKGFASTVVPYVTAIWAVFVVKGVFFSLYGPAWLGTFRMRRLFVGGNLSGSLLSGVLIVSVVIALSAIPGLLGRSRRGWRILFISTLTTFFGSMLFASGQIVTVLLMISVWYILFQIRDLYRK